MIIENFSKWTLGFVSALAAIILSGGIALAQTAPITPTTATTKPSDYAVDVKQGQQTLQTDPAAAAQAKEVNGAENDEGDVDNDPVEVAEAVEPAEAEEQTEANENGEASGSNDSNGGNNSERSGSSGESSGSNGSNSGSNSERSGSSHGN